MNRDDCRSAVTEDMAAITALEIAENLLVHDITDFAAGDRSGGTTEQTSEDGASKPPSSMPAGPPTAPTAAPV